MEKKNKKNEEMIKITNDIAKSLGGGLIVIEDKVVVVDRQIDDDYDYDEERINPKYKYLYEEAKREIEGDLIRKKIVLTEKEKKIKIFERYFELIKENIKKDQKGN